MKNLANLISKVKEITASGLPFMDGKEKGEIDKLIGTTVAIDEYGYMVDDGKDYAVFTCQEYPNHFFFGGSVLTDSLKSIDEALTDSEIADLLEQGIPTLFEKKKSKNKREYTKCTFFPNAE